MKFLSTCYRLAEQVKCPKLKFKLLQVSELNPTNQSISFHFHHFVYYTMPLFVLWIIESLSLVLMASRTV